MVREFPVIFKTRPSGGHIIPQHYSSESPYGDHQDKKDDYSPNGGFLYFNLVDRIDPNQGFHISHKYGKYYWNINLIIVCCVPLFDQNTGTPPVPRKVGYDFKKIKATTQYLDSSAPNYTIINEIVSFKVISPGETHIYRFGNSKFDGLTGRIDNLKTGFYGEAIFFNVYTYYIDNTGSSITTNGYIHATGFGNVKVGG